MNKKATVLVVDGGGRGAVLVEKYAQSKQVEKVLAVPGNDLMKINTEKKVEIYPELKTTSVVEICEICQKEGVSLVDVAQDNAIEVGLVDVLRQKGLAVVGPTRAAGRIEWDKSWARELLKKAGVRQPRHQIFTNFRAGIDYLRSQRNRTWFVKASGLAQGHGALPALNNEEAIERITELKRFGSAAEKFLIEEWLTGEEFSAFVISDGRSHQLVGFAQDHKRVNDFDEGENTGGMGCASRPLVVTPEIASQTEEIMVKTLGALKAAGAPYEGILYLGGMIVPEKTGPRVYVIEFNARWGDPEAQVLIPAIDGDLFEISMATFKRNLDELKVGTDNQSRVVVAGAVKGYPGRYPEVKGKQIFGLEEARQIEDVRLYGAGVKEEDGCYYASGGRLFYIVGEGKSIIEARQKAYGAMSLVSVWGNNLHFRTDIGWRDVQRLRENAGL